MTLEIRDAHSMDIDETIPLSYAALRDYANYMTMSQDKQIVVKRLKKFFNSPLVNQLHISSFSILTINNGIAGAISSYPGNLVPVYNKNTSKIIETLPAPKSQIQKATESIITSMEADADEYYIDILSVKPEFKGKGFATRLLLLAEEKAKRANFKKLALVVDAKEHSLIEFYKRQSFTIKNIKVLGGIKYYGMVKYI